MKRSTQIALVVFVVLLIGVVWNAQRKPERGMEGFSFAEIPVDAVDTLVFSGKHDVTLKKVDDQWTLNGRRVDMQPLDRLLASLPKVASRDLLTSDAGRFAEFEVDDDQGIRLVASAGGTTLAEFVVGKNMQQRTVVRVGGDAFWVRGIYRSNFDRAPGDWYDRTVMPAQAKETQQVRVELRDQPPFTLVKQNDAWALEDPSVLPPDFRFDATMANTFVTTLTNLRANRILEETPPAETTGLSGSVDRFLIQVPSGETPRTFELRVGKQEGTELYAMVDGKDPFTVFEGTVKNLRKQPGDFRDLTLMRLDRAQVQTLRAQAGSRFVELQNKEGTWQVAAASPPAPEGFTLDPGAAQRWLSQLVSARAMKPAFGVTPQAAGLNTPTAKVTATLQDGSKVTLNFGKPYKDEGREMVYARGNTDTRVYLAAQWTRTSLVPELDQLKRQEKPPGLANIDPESLKNLPPEVRESVMKQLRKKQQEEALLKALKKQQEDFRGRDL